MGLICAALVASAVAFAAPAAACELALSLVLDLSGSMKPPDRALVLGGTANALRNPAVIDAFAGQDAMVNVIAFAGNAVVLVPWTQIGGADDLFDVATATEGASPEFRNGGTNISGALAVARAELAKVECGREVVDILTDAQKNGGGTHPRDEVALFDPWQTINVLLIGQRANIDVHTELRHGFAGFVLPIASLAEVEMATIKKLLLEIM